jgi:hypothetical protein
LALLLLAKPKFHHALSLETGNGFSFEKTKILRR